MKRTPIKKVSKAQARRNHGLGKLKAYLFLRSHGLCEICGKCPDWRGLAVHHIRKRSHGGSDKPENLLVVCGRCHSKEHDIVEASPGEQGRA